MSHAEAQRAARLALGGMEQTKELHRDARSFNWLDDARRDVAYAGRLIRRTPVFSLTVALSLAIGIGATTAIFTIANGLLLRTAPGVADPDSLVDISRTNGQFGVNPIWYPNYQDIRSRAAALDGVFAYGVNIQPIALQGGGSTAGAEAVFGSVVTVNYFSVLGVTPAVGRVFDAGDSEELGASQIAVLSHECWTRRFSKDPAVVGRTIRLNDQPFTVVGVAAERFRGTTLLAPDLWIPSGARPFTDSARSARFMAGGSLVGGRLKNGVSMSEAAAEIDGIGRALERDYPEDNRGAGLRLSGSSPIPAGLRLVAAGFLAFLMGLVSVVLVIACANVAGVLLARAAARRREIAVRLAMGVGRSRLIRQLLTETVLLFAAGGAAGLWLARVFTTFLFSLLPAATVPINIELPLDVRVAAFAIGVSLVAAVLSGLAPALQASSVDVVVALKDDVQGPSDRLRLRSAFVVAQVAFSILLVVVAGLLGRALTRTSAAAQGLDFRGVEAASVDLTLGGYTAVSGPVFASELLNRVRELPGVESASLAIASPAGAGGIGLSVAIPGLVPPNGEPFFRVTGNVVESGYLATLGIPLVAGRDFDLSDRTGSLPVAMVSESAARRFWPGTPVEDVVGQSIATRLAFEVVSTSVKRPGAIESPKPAMLATSRVVIGVARDVGVGDAAARPYVYLPFQQQYMPAVTVLARTTSNRRIGGDLRALVATMNPRLPVLSAGPLEQDGPVITQLRVAAAVSGSVGLVGLLLAGIGIYGVTAYTVARRTREIGIRVALGARRADVVRMILRQGLILVGVGSAIGMTLALASGRLLIRLLYGVSPLDPLTLATAILILGSVGLMASIVPARRATRINPVDALRHD